MPVVSLRRSFSGETGRKKGEKAPFRLPFPPTALLFPAVQNSLPEGGEGVGESGGGEASLFAAAPVLGFHLASGEAFAPYNDLRGQTDEIGILELTPGRSSRSSYRTSSPSPSRKSLISSAFALTSAFLGSRLIR